MNDHTREALTAYREYWSTTESPFSDEEVAKIDGLLADPPMLTDTQWEELFDRLSGEEGINFRDGDNGTTWSCKGGNDKTFATEILMDMGIDEQERRRALELVDVFGGHCDCEILFNAQERILS